MEVRRAQQVHVRRIMADALALAAKHAPPASFRIVLYTEDRRALADLAKLGVERVLNA